MLWSLFQIVEARRYDYTSFGVIGILFMTIASNHLLRLVIRNSSSSDTLRNIPLAPGSHWFFGHLRRILREPTGYPAREWINTVPNHGLIRYHMWFKTRILVTRPESLADVTVTDSYSYVKSSLVRNTLGRITGVGLLLQEADVHRVHRKALMPAFTFRHTRDLSPIFWLKAREFVRCLDLASRRGKPVEMMEWSSRVTLDIIGLGGMGMEFDSVRDPDSELARAYRDVFSRPITSPVGKRLQLLGLIFPNWLITRIPIRHNREINRSMRRIRQVCGDLIARKRRTLADLAPGREPDVDIMNAALGATAFTDGQLVDHVMTFLAAGHETIANALTAAVILLCRHADVQSRLRREIRAHLPAVPLADDGDDAAATAIADRLHGCHYLQAVCLEVLRLWPPVALTFRTADRDTHIGPQLIPRGTSIVLCPWAVNASRELWGDDAEEFRPARWLDAEGRANMSEGALSNYAFMTFLHGPRGCIGQRFAQAEFACLVAALVGNFEMGFAEGTALARGEAEFGGTISVKPKGDLWCDLRRVPGWK